MNTKQLKYARVLAKAGSFSKAANELNISQPSLSQYIKKIETDAGVTLFERTGGYVKLTDAGRVYIEAGEKILSVEKGMESAFLDVKEYKTGSLTVGMSHFRTSEMLVALSRDFKSKYPGICLVVEEDVLGEILDCAERGVYDIAIAPAPIDENVFRAEKVMEEELVLAVPKSLSNRFNPKIIEGKKYPAVDLVELQNAPFIMGESAQAVQSAFNSLLKKYGVSVDAQIVIKRLEMQLELAKQGLGIALIPTGIKRENDEKVVYYSLIQDLPKREIMAIYKKDAHLSCVGRYFIDLMKQKYL